MEILNEDGSVQAIAFRDGYRFFVECDVDDDIVIIAVPDLTEEEAEKYAKMMSHAWDEAMEYSEKMHIESF